MFCRTLLCLTFSAGVLLAATTEGKAQSFDCANATQPDEKAVCASGKLSGLDDEMSALYNDIESHALMGTSGEVRDGQRAFLVQRADCGADDACLRKTYQARIAQLKKVKEEVGQGAKAD